MSSENKSEAIALFTALTGENAITAEQYLEACDYDVTEVCLERTSKQISL